MTNAPQEPVDLTDPAISPHQLQELAQTHPEYWDDILRHPNVYPGLADWIRDRQADQSAQQAAVDQAEAFTTSDDDDATKVFESVDTSEDATSVLEPTDGEPLEPETDPVNDEAEPQAAETDQDATASSWATPDPSGHQSSEPASTAFDDQPWSQETPQQPAPEEPTWGWPGATATSGTQQQYQAPSSSYSQPPYGYQQPPQQPPYGYAQPYGQQPLYGQQFQQRPRPRTPIDLNSARTWGLFVAGGAAFMTLFGYFFNPTLASFGMPSTSHVASGGWIILLLFLATVTLSILQLLKPSAWMRYFFIIVSFGAAFSMIGRTTALIGFFTMQNTSFSVIWMLFMSLVLLAGIMVYTAPKPSDDSTSQRQPTAPTPGYAPGQQQAAQPPFGAYGEQPPTYPQPGSNPYGGPSQGGPQN